MNLLNALKQEIAGLDFSRALPKTVSFLRQNVAHYNWVGVYMLEGDELVLKAWDGPEATQHTRIPIGKGICGLAAREKRTVIVGDVNADPRYLACFPYTRSEIVVPILKGTQVLGEIDIDSNTLNAFTEKDREFLEQVAALLGERYG
ncbi:MAG: GAF domain-containing protein [Candidatus Bipolaricaulota bacterium]|nr:GAF domain-containing protein [Candidatus Bipolaricaulota bacterium]MCS7274778.1 GAF domain-containing protein [Candidatus Bipolaricaulota bacterium]MDW8110058.1 GAF domain-containing protein [Candidatus Bipolaricaulota bacterium]MDW8329483.1 GAF domain-containing protein [Candidatus Bipolaricaulota bacterium]